MEIIHLENEDLKKLIQNKILVDFFANWCGPCKMMSSVLEKTESDIKVVKIDVNKFENIAKEYGIMSIPTIILFENGKEVKRNIGFIDSNNLKKFLE